MPTFLSIILSLFGIFLIHLLLGIRRVARNVGSVTLTLKYSVYQPPSRGDFSAIFPVYSFFLTHFLLWDFCLHRSGTSLTYFWDLRGGLVRNMKVRMHDKPSKGS